MLFFPNAAVNNEQCFNVTIVDDDVVELNEDIRYVGSSTTSGVTFINDVEFLVNDNDC